MQVICLEEPAFYALVDEVVLRLREKHSPENNDKWINNEQAMKMLNIKSKTTMQSLRDEGKIRFSQPSKKTILYDRDSILAYIENNSKDTF